MIANIENSRIWLHPFTNTQYTTLRLFGTAFIWPRICYGLLVVRSSDGEKGLCIPKTDESAKTSLLSDIWSNEDDTEYCIKRASEPTSVDTQKTAGLWRMKCRFTRRDNYLPISGHT